MSNRDEFYIGYLPSAPASLGLWLASRVRLLLLGFVALGLALALSMGAFARAHFEYGNPREFTGTIEEFPYPRLLVQRPGVAAGEDVAMQSSYLLVSFGKLGAGPALRGLDGKQVTLEGTLIYRDDQTMVELVAGSVEVIGNGEITSGAEHDLGTQTLLGEIVDSKCFLGVMKPGNLKPHRACATRCISGGVPPVLMQRDSAGRATYLLLVSEEGKAVNKEVLDFVAEPISVTGRVVRSGSVMTLYANPASYQRLR